MGAAPVEITDIRVFPVDEDKLKAYVTITLDNCFVVRDLKVISGVDGLFIAMPAKRRKDGSYKDIAHPLNADTRLWMERAILAAYHVEARRGGNGVRGNHRVRGNGLAGADGLGE